MSFSSEVKNELCKVKTPACCRMAECYGMLLFGRAFSLNSIVLNTEYQAVADRLVGHLRRCFRVKATVSLSGVRRNSFTVGVYSKEDCVIIYHRFFAGAVGEGSGLMTEILQKECCVPAFIRGAFLSCGSIVDPRKEYHAEFCLHGNQPAEEFAALLKQQGLSPKISVRGGTKVLYFKGSEQIENLLTLVKATRFMLELAEIKVYKDVRNHYNRVTNCEAANISKTVSAAVAQQKAIARLKKTGGYEKLTAELKAAALLRQTYPDASLQELCRLSETPITKSGLNHRLKKLVELAENTTNRG